MKNLSLEKFDTYLHSFLTIFAPTDIPIKMETLIMHPENKEQLAALKALAKALKIPFEKKKAAALTERERTVKLYGAEFVAKIEEAQKRGNYKEVDATDIWGSLNLK